MPSTSTGEDSWTSSGLDFLIALDRHSRGLGAALQQAIRDAIRAGQLHPGDTLPSTRGLAADLGVARGTVVEAYEQLVAEGWLMARHGLGTSVADLPAAPPPPAEPPPVPAPRHDLRPGHADPSSFPRQRCAAVPAGNPGGDDLARPPGTVQVFWRRPRFWLLVVSGSASPPRGVHLQGLAAEAAARSRLNDRDLRVLTTTLMTAPWRLSWPQAAGGHHRRGGCRARVAPGDGV